MVNFNQLLKQAQSMQKQMASTEYYGKAGGGLVNITVSGHGDLRKVAIDVSLLKETEKELLEDLIVAAFSDARSKVDEDSQNSMLNAFGKIDLPPGLKMPF